MSNTVDVDFSEFEQRLRTLLYELNGKRVQTTICQGELSNIMLQMHDLERQLDVERRSAQSMQMQLELSLKATQRSDTDRDIFSQRATRSEVQLMLANQEIGILREECKKLELQVMKLNQEVVDQTEQVNKLSAFKDSCSGLQNRVKSTLVTVAKEIESLHAEFQRIFSYAQSSMKHSTHFQRALQHFMCLEKRQAQERQDNAKLLAEMKAKIYELTEERNIIRSSDCTEGNTNTWSLKQYQLSVTALEQRLKEEQVTTQRLIESLSKATNSQQSLQHIEEGLSIKVKELEAKLEATVISETSLKQQLEKTRMEYKTEKKEANHKLNHAETQTNPGAPPSPSISTFSSVSTTESVNKKKVQTFSVNELLQQSNNDLTECDMQVSNTENG